MKLTIEIDDELMERVKDITCADTEQQAIELSMMSMSSDAAAKEYFSIAKPHPTYAELRNAYAPDYDPRAPIPNYAGA